MFKKTFAVTLEQIDGALRVHVEGCRDCMYLAAAELVLSTNKAENSNAEILEVMNTVGSRSIERGISYMVLTCIGPRGLSTSLSVVCQDLDSALRELEILCSLVESVSRGKLRCIRIKDPISMFKRCFSESNPIDFLIEVFSKKYRGETQTPFVLHPVAVNPSYTLYTAKDFSYLSSVFSNGSIAIGHLHLNSNIVVTLNDDHLLKHIAIVGATGSGKSTTAAIIAEKSARRGYAVTIIDWHGEYKALLSQAEDVVYTNPLKKIVPEPLNFEDLIKREPLSFIEILESALELTAPQAHILEEAVNILAQRHISSSYCIDTIIDIIQNSSASARWYAESREALLRKLKPLSSSYLNIHWDKLHRVPIEKGKVYIFDVSLIPNVRVRKVLSSLFIRSVVLKAQYNNIEKPILIVVDEAHNIFYLENPLSILIAEVRKWGVGFVVITQTPSMLAPVVLKNTNTKIVHSLKSYNDLRSVIAVTNLKKEHRKIVSALKPGEALLVMPELAEPVLVKICRI